MALPWHWFRQPRQTGHSYPESRAILWIDSLEFLFNHFHDSDILRLQRAQAAKTLHPGLAPVRHATGLPQLFFDRVGYKLLKSDTACDGSHFRSTECGIGNLQCRFHSPSFPYLWVLVNWPFRNTRAEQFGLRFALMFG